MCLAVKEQLLQEQRAEDSAKHADQERAETPHVRL